LLCFFYSLKFYYFFYWALLISVRTKPLFSRGAFATPLRRSHDYTDPWLVLFSTEWLSGLQHKLALIISVFPALAFEKILFNLFSLCTELGKGSPPYLFEELLAP